MSYVTLEQAKVIFNNIKTPEEEVVAVLEGVKNRHIANVENATTQEQLVNLRKNHVRLINNYELAPYLYEEDTQKWRYGLIKRIDQRIADLQSR